MSEAGSEASVYVATHRESAAALGRQLADLIDDPENFVTVLRRELRELSDSAYVHSVERVRPGTGSDLSVRGPLLAAAQRPLRRALGESSAASALSLAQRLAQCEERELRIFALPCLDRSIGEDPERTWQAMRQIARRAGDWTEIDALAEMWAKGVLAEPFRWAELEQLAYSQRVMERRLVGATLARMTRILPHTRRHTLRGAASRRALELLHQLIGDSEPMVQKALSWALREWSDVDPSSVRQFLLEESSIALRHGDGNRAWVLRDALSRQPPEVSSELKHRLSGVRRSPDGPSTSIAAGQAAAFAPAVEAHGTVAQQGDRYTRSRP
ncbi:MAG: DNA alkylation repair protein [Chloroflexota bacterium]